MTHEQIRAIYLANLPTTASASGGEFPQAPSRPLPPGEFVNELIRRAAECDVRAAHPFLKNVVSGRYSKLQLREWVRQDYQHVLGSIRRHALAAAAATDCDLLRALLAYVGVEADADPVGGTYFALPQLWVKLGITLGLTRDELVHAEPAAALAEWEDRATEAARRQQGVPVGLFVNAMLDPALASCIGPRLHAQLGFSRDCFDYFWAVAGNRWGEDAGRLMLESWCATAADQRNIWSRYAAERAVQRESERLTLLQQAVETIANP